MSLVPRDPFDALMPLREAMNQLLEGSFVGPRLDIMTSKIFPIDVYETDDRQQYVIEAALPGMKQEDLQVSAEGDTITIRATKKGEQKVGKGRYMRQERYEGEMSRTISLPTSIDSQKVQATYENGVLMLNVPKAEGAKQKQIPVKVKTA
jgi:HSP20 family protein